MIFESFKRFQPFYEEDSDFGGMEEGVEEQEFAEPADEEGVEEQELAEPAESKSDAAFAQMRRELDAMKRERESWQQKQYELESQLREREDALGLFFDGEDKVAQAKAHYEGVPVEQIKRDMEQAKLNAEKDARIESQQHQIDMLTYNNLKADDLRAIKAAHPEAKLSDVEELGETFFQYRSMGIDAVKVYEALELKKGNPPKPFGKVQTGKAEKDYYTREDVENMSSDEIHKNYDLIRKSMSKWK